METTTASRDERAVVVAPDAQAWIDDCGVLHVGDDWVVLPDVEWRLMELLVSRFAMTVRRHALIAAAWPDDADKETALNVRIGSLRRRIEPLALRITNVRGRGYVLDHVGPS